MKKVKESRAISFLVLLVVYTAATVFGIILYRVLPYNFWLNLLLADIAATVFTFIFSLVFKNASVYDPYWSVQPIVIVIYAFLFTGTVTPLRLMLVLTITLWGCRLTANWAYTFQGLNFQDWRYTMLHSKTGVFYPVINFIGIHMVPTLVVYACTMPAVFAMVYESSFHPLSCVFILLSVVAFTMQGTADIQMHSFRIRKQLGIVSEPFIRVGLWKHSRHPNYLGEICMWWGIGLSVVSAMPSKWYLLTGALLNTMLFLFVSIPMADGRQSSKAGFEQYKSETRKLLPIPKKS